MDLSSEHHPSEDLDEDESTYEDVTSSPGKAATPLFNFAEAAATPPFPQAASTRTLGPPKRKGKQPAGVSSASKPRYVYNFTRVTEAIYGQVGTTELAAPSYQSPPKNLVLPPKNLVPPPLHPRTISMVDPLDMQDVSLSTDSQGQSSVDFNRSDFENTAPVSEYNYDSLIVATTVASARQGKLKSKPKIMPKPAGHQVPGKGFYNRKTTQDPMVISTSRIIPVTASIVLPSIEEVPSMRPGVIERGINESGTDMDSQLQLEGRGDDPPQADVHCPWVSTTIDSRTSDTCSEAVLSRTTIPNSSNFDTATNTFSTPPENDVTEILQRKAESPCTLAGTKNEEKDDAIITEMQKMKMAESNSQSSEQENPYDDIVICRAPPIICCAPPSCTSSKPSIPMKPPNINTHPKVVKMRYLKRQKQLQEIEEIYDFDELSDSEVEEIYTDSADIKDHDSHMPGVAGNQLSVQETVHPEGIEGLTEKKSFDRPIASDDDSTDYEDLVIYEELASDKDAGYQDIEKARAEALGLPKNIRRRVMRIVKGPQRRRLRRSIKSKSFHDFGSPKLIDESDDTTPSNSENSLDPKTAAHICRSGSSSSEDETRDGYMSHDKARQVLDMLLEANNVTKFADRGRSQSVQERETAREFETSSLDFALPPEVAEYQKDGILQTKSLAEIAAEIQFLTNSAPKEPPPLPGLLRSRAQLVTRADDVIRKRKVLTKTNTFPNDYNNS